MDYKCYMGDEGSMDVVLVGPTNGYPYSWQLIFGFELTKI